MFGGLDIGIYDIIIPAVTITPERQAAYNFSRPYMATPESGFFSIAMKKGNDRLTEAINRVLEDMFSDGTMHRISVGTLGMDLVTQARQAW
jgi:ABC-type amino acid transport substrate-binding protein